MQFPLAADSSPLGGADSRIARTYVGRPRAWGTLDHAWVHERALEADAFLEQRLQLAGFLAAGVFELLLNLREAAAQLNAA